MDAEVWHLEKITNDKIAINCWVRPQSEEKK